MSLGERRVAELQQSLTATVEKVRETANETAEDSLVADAENVAQVRSFIPILYIHAGD